MANWSNELIVKFLELYQNEPVLWDPMHCQRKDKNTINEAWLCICSCNIDDIHIHLLIQ